MFCRAESPSVTSGTAIRRLPEIVAGRVSYLQYVITSRTTGPTTAPVFHWIDEHLPDTDSAHAVLLAFTTNEGGVSESAWEGMNLGGNTGDHPDHVRRNRSAVAAAFGVEHDHLLFMDQCHGSTVVAVDGPWVGDAPRADGIVTRATDLALAVLVADCVPVLLVDPAAGVVGAVHAGRPGMTGGVVAEAVSAMRDLGAKKISAAVGPSVCGRCYEVPPVMRAAAAAVSPVSATVSWTGTPAIDVAGGVVDQLTDAGVAVTWVPGCTREDPRLYSYRRDGVTGRFAGVVRLLSGRTA